MTTEPTGWITKAARNELFALVARALITLAVVGGIPAAGWVIARVVNTGDTISAKLDENVSQFKLLKQAVKFGFEQNKNDLTAVKSEMADHETRIRSLEVTSRAPPSRP